MAVLQIATVQVCWSWSLGQFERILKLCIQAKYSGVPRDRLLREVWGWWDHQLYCILPCLYTLAHFFTQEFNILKKEEKICTKHSSWLFYLCFKRRYPYLVFELSGPLIWPQQNTVYLLLLFFSMFTSWMCFIESSWCYMRNKRCLKVAISLTQVFNGSRWK